MYGLVPYNISPIQQGIQFGHAVVEYGLFHNDDVYDTWARQDKTFVILNGGTTNKSDDHPGSLNTYVDNLARLGIKASCFYEPDLGDQLTAVVFLLDERIWDRETFPDHDVHVDSHVSENEYYEEMWGWDWRKILEKRQFISQFRLA